MHGKARGPGRGAFGYVIGFVAVLAGCVEAGEGNGSDAGPDGVIEVEPSWISHAVVVRGKHAGDAKVTLTYLGRSLEAIVHVVP